MVTMIPEFCPVLILVSQMIERGLCSFGMSITCCHRKKIYRGGKFEPAARWGGCLNFDTHEQIGPLEPLSEVRGMRMRA